MLNRLDYSFVNSIWSIMCDTRDMAYEPLVLINVMGRMREMREIVR